MSDEFKACETLDITELDHPCKETCSGWSQGYDKGKRAYDELKAELALLEQAARPLVNERLIAVTKERDQLRAELEQDRKEIQYHLSERRILHDKYAELLAQANALAEALFTAINHMRFTDSLDLTKNETNRPTLEMFCEPALKEWNEWKREKNEL